MSFQIKKAVPENIPQILALIREFAEYEKLSEFCEVTEERLLAALFGETKVAEAIVVFDRERAVGYACFYPNFASFRGQRGIFLEDILISGE
jgi:hypothetical protein